MSLPAAADAGPAVRPDLLTPNADFYRVDTALTVPRGDKPAIQVEAPMPARFGDWS